MARVMLVALLCCMALYMVVGFLRVPSTDPVPDRYKPAALFGFQTPRPMLSQ